MLSYFALPVFNDNYIWVIHNFTHCWVVDPGECIVVAAALKSRGLKLAGVLITHKHWDHITGIKGLLKGAPLPVYGPKSIAISQINTVVAKHTQIPLGQTTAEVLELPGHTIEHIGYHIKKFDWLFSGDTLFSAGCGRLFDGSAEQLFASLSMIKALPPATKIFASHEYTLANLRFANAVEPSNTSIVSYRRICEAARADGRFTLPTTLAQELQINPFLRTNVPRVRDAVEAQLGSRCANEFEIFKAMRQWKDTFR